MIKALLFWAVTAFACLVVIVHCLQAALCCDKEATMDIRNPNGFWSWLYYLFLGKHESYPLWWIYTLVGLMYCCV